MEEVPDWGREESPVSDVAENERKFWLDCLGSIQVGTYERRPPQEYIAFADHAIEEITSHLGQSPTVELLSSQQRLRRLHDVGERCDREDQSAELVLLGLLEELNRRNRDPDEAFRNDIFLVLACMQHLR